MNIAQFRAKRAEAVKSFQALADKMNADDYDEKNAGADQKEFDRIEGEIKDFTAKIDRAEKAQALAGQSAIVIAGQGADMGTDKALPFPKKRYGVLKSFKGVESGVNAETRAYESGMFILAAILNNEKAKEWCSERGLLIKAAQSEGTPSAGGYLVPTVFESTIIDLREQYGTFRKECGVVPMGSDKINFPKRTSGVTAYYPGEGGSITTSQMGWGQVALLARKLAALIPFSSELAEDAVISIADWLANEIAYAFAVAEDAAGWNGDGTSTYGGITGVKAKFVAGLSSFVGAVDLASGHDSFGEVDAADIAKVVGTLPKYALPRAKFYCSQACWANVFARLVAAAGGNTVDTLTGVIRPSYWGFPVVIDQTLLGGSPATDNSDIPLFYFGDLSLAAIMGERRGLSIAVSDQAYFSTDQLAIRGTERYDINVHSIGDTSVAGPLVAAMGE